MVLLEYVYSLFPIQPKYFSVGRLIELLDLTAYEKVLKMEGMFPCKTQPIHQQFIWDTGRTLSLKTEKEIQVIMSKWVTASMF